MLTASQVETTVHGLVSFYSSVRTPFAVSLGLPHSKNSHSKSNHSGRMDKEKTDWKIEKERLLSLNLEERRKEYRRQEYTTLGEVITWRQECKENAKVEESEPTGGSSTSDKVSLHKGDITVLEVDAIVNAGRNRLSLLPFRNCRSDLNLQSSGRYAVIRLSFAALLCRNPGSACWCRENFPSDGF
ncbi:ADP-ribose glycohydrolase MACROD2 [Gadus macrocephalus]|uniref:ADP-ribose glycohydrolase MACROD2 n=1 Tax=Gadus macrocephalus TaxID=80720 RepID=UPI0028CB2720|nr:ADP-ribose glycohydrolase MACROD2 [Gadus macrocephalus]